MTPPSTTVDLTRVGVSGISRGLDGVLYTPAGEGPWPGVVLLFEVFGADDVMHRHAQRMAAAGYLTLMPDLYAQGGPRRCMLGTLRSMFSGSGRAYADIEAARRWLVASPRCTGAVGSIGFCMGGGFALATANAGFDAAAVNYGPLQRKGLDAELAGACPVVASYGAADPSLKGAAAKIEAVLTRLDVPHDVKEYPGAGHSFLNDADNAPRLLRPYVRIMGIGPRPEQAADAWRRIEAFFGEHLH
ncbi:dienelactone hydrolase family protein [Spongisporangium articulatum]|uniref:Dienelactone hydrolase family protein n=1 Tax=Spongisporangium articulatum TaxID=3362603 RepID=A0ABW8AGY4_9ACTN